jgi:O-antigen ligase
LKFARFLFWIGLLGAAFACIDFYFQLPALARYAPQFVWLKHGVLRRAQGVFYEASTLGNVCAFFLVMILVASFQPGGQPGGQRVCSRSALISGAVFFSAALIASSSRASVVAVVTAGCMFVWLRRLKMKVIVMAMCAMGAAAVVVRVAMPSFSATYWSRMSLSIQTLWSYPNEVLSGRVTQWNSLADFLARHPWHLLFGIGYKTIPYTDYIGARLVADNTYLSLLVETGIAGLAVFAALNVAILRTAYRAARLGSFFGVWIFCFWCGETVQMLSGDLITYWRVLPVYFWVLATAARESGE